MSDIAAWLEALDLGKYAAVFAENEIDFKVLPELTEEDIRELGLPLGPRRKLLSAGALPDSLPVLALSYGQRAVSGNPAAEQSGADRPRR